MRVTQTFAVFPSLLVRHAGFAFVLARDADGKPLERSSSIGSLPAATVNESAYSGYSGGGLNLSVASAAPPAAAATACDYSSRYNHLLKRLKYLSLRCNYIIEEQ